MMEYQSSEMTACYWFLGVKIARDRVVANSPDGSRIAVFMAEIA